MPDFTATRTFLYVAGNIISPTQNTTNETAIYAGHNSSMNGTSGHTHSGSTGDGPVIPMISPAARVVAGAADNLSATDVMIGMSNAGARALTFTQAASTAFKRTVTVYDAGGNGGLYPTTITFAGGWTCQGLTTITIPGDYCSVTFLYDLVNWRIIASE